MAQFKTDIYMIHCLTPLHAGSGDTNYGDIDKLVQRDPTNNLPAIYSSALKGALKEFCRHNGVDEKDIASIFGEVGMDEDSNDTQNSNPNTQKSKPGKCRFFSADLLCLPVQGINSPFYLATSPSIIEEINLKMETLDAKLNWSTEFEANSIALNYGIKGNVAIENSLKAHTNRSLYFISDFHSLIAAKLPVIARNHLVNGESENLWYEEIVPRETRFVFAVSAFEKDKSELTKLSNAIKDKTVHIGAHATIGYGYCKITKLN